MYVSLRLPLSLSCLRFLYFISHKSSSHFSSLSLSLSLSPSPLHFYFLSSTLSEIQRWVARQQQPHSCGCFFKSSGEYWRNHHAAMICIFCNIYDLESAKYLRWLNAFQVKLLYFVNIKRIIKSCAVYINKNKSYTKYTWLAYFHEQKHKYNCSCHIKCSNMYM